MATTTTPNLGLTLAVPGSNEPFDTAVVNANFEAIDDEVGSQRADSTTTDTRLDTIEKFTNPTVANPTMGISPAGTSAQRDGLYGVPADAAARVALANKAPRWFNTEKGYEQQYFAATADAGSGPFSRTTAGWQAAISNGGHIPLRPPTVTNSGGSFVRDGGAIAFTNVTELRVDGIFTSDFRDYLMIVEAQPGASATPTMRLRQSGVDYASAGAYGYSSSQTIGNAAAPGGSNNENKYYMVGTNVLATAGMYAQVVFNRPQVSGSIPRLMQSQFMGYNGANAIVGSLMGFTIGVAPCDGINLFVASGQPWTGTVRFFGISDY